MDVLDGAGDGRDGRGEPIATFARNGPGPVHPTTAEDLKARTIPGPPGGLSLVAPQFSRDGRYLSAVSEPPGSVWVIDAANARAGAWTRVPIEGNALDPTWLADARMLLVADGRPVTWLPGDAAISVLATEGDEPGRVSWPVASPRSPEVAWTTSTQVNGGGDIHLANATTSVIRSVTASSEREGFAAWRNDGTALAIEVDDFVAIVDLSTLNVQGRVAGQGSISRPGWLGDDLVWFEQRGEAWDLWRVIEGQGARPLAFSALRPNGPIGVSPGRIWVADAQEPGALWAVAESGQTTVFATTALSPIDPALGRSAAGWLVAFSAPEVAAGARQIQIAPLPGGF
jgi:hypothetical protein